MRPHEWKRTVASVLTENWVLLEERRLAFIRPIEWVLFGVQADGPASRSTYYLNQLRMPLYVPNDVIDLSWSDRFGGPSCQLELNEESPGQIASAMAVIEREAKKGEVILKPPGGAENYRMMEARAYGFVIEDRIDAAIEMLKRVVSYADTAKYDWEIDLVTRASESLRLLHDGKSAELAAELTYWRLSTLEKLGIDLKYAVQDPYKAK